MDINTLEKEMLIRTLNVPLNAFGFDKFQKYFSEEEISSIKKQIIFIEENCHIQSGTLTLLVSAFLVARDICDQREYQTLTGYDWNDSLALIMQMIKNIENKN